VTRLDLRALTLSISQELLICMVNFAHFPVQIYPLYLRLYSLRERDEAGERFRGGTAGEVSHGRTAHQKEELKSTCPRCTQWAPPTGANPQELSPAGAGGFSFFDCRADAARLSTKQRTCQGRSKSRPLWRSRQDDRGPPSTPRTGQIPRKAATRFKTQAQFATRLKFEAAHPIEP